MLQDQVVNAHGQFVNAQQHFAHALNLTSWILATLLVYVFAKQFFDNKQYHIVRADETEGTMIKYIAYPALPRNLVEQHQYRQWEALFLIFVLIIFLFIGITLSTFDVNINGIPKLYQPYPPLVAALLLTGALPIKQYRNILIRIRDALHRRAQIPERALLFHRAILNGNVRMWSRDDYYCILRKHISLMDNVLIEKDITESAFTTERKWSLCCHIMCFLYLKSESANSNYYKVLLSDDIQFNEISQIFKRLVERVGGCRDEQGRISTSVDNDVDFLLKLLSQCVVCLILTSEATETRADDSFREMGVDRPHAATISLNIYEYVVWLFAFLFIMTIIIYILAVFVPTDFVQGEFKAFDATRVIFGVFLTLILPFSLSIVLRAIMLDRYPVRQLDQEPRMEFIIICCCVGGVVGVIGLLFLKQLGYFEGVSDWRRERLPFALVSVGMGMLGGVVTDRIPRRCRERFYPFYIVSWAAIAVAMMLPAAALCTLLVENVPVSQIGYSLLYDNFMAIFLPCLIAAGMSVLGVWTLDRSYVFPRNMDEYGLVISRLYNEGGLLRSDVIPREGAQMSDVLPDCILRHLEKNACVDRQRRLTEKGAEYVQSLTAVHIGVSG